MIIDRKGRDLMLLAVPDPFQVNRKPEVSAVAATSSLSFIIMREAKGMLQYQQKWFYNMVTLRSSRKREMSGGRQTKKNNPLGG